MRNSVRLLMAVMMVVPAGLVGGCGSDSSTGPFTPTPQTDAAGGSAGSGQDAEAEAAPEAGPEAALESGPETATEDVATPEPEPEPQPEAGPQDAGPEAEAGPTWPDCKQKPAGATDKTISAIWANPPAAPEYTWVSGAFVTAISKNGCVAGSTCQIFLQDAETYASWSASAHHGIKMLISGNTASYFTAIKVGDKVDVAGHAWRYNYTPPQNELLLQVNKALPGCALATGVGAPSPVTGVQLSDLSVDAYENSHGPILMQVSAVTGKPGPATEIFAIWNTSGPFLDAGPESVVSVSPYFLAGASFSGLPTDGLTAVKFSTISGVFGLFVPTSDAGTAKYMVLYPRDNAELVKLTP